MKALTAKDVLSIVGCKFYRYDEDENLDLLRVVGVQNIDTIKIRHNDGKEEKVNPAKILDNYRMLNSDGIITFSLVTVDAGNGQNIDDVIVCIHRKTDLDNGQAVPYAVCRQNVINTYSTVIMKHSTDWEVGMTMSVETIPEGIDYNIMTACNTCDKVIAVAAYLDDNLEDILGLVKPKDLHEYDFVLNELYKDHINNIPKLFREEACKAPIHKGYCRYLAQLLDYTDFMYDLERAFGIAKINDIEINDECIEQGDLINGFIMKKPQLEIIEKAYGFKFINPIFMLFDKDIDIDELSDEIALVKDCRNKIFLCNYIKNNLSRR